MKKTYEEIIAKIPLELSLWFKLRTKLNNLRYRFIPNDEFDWRYYHEYYRAEVEWNKKHYTLELNDENISIINGKIYLLSDSFPMNPTNRCVWETLLNLPKFETIAEIGCGNGRYLAGLYSVWEGTRRYSGYDLSKNQLIFFKESYPALYEKIMPEVLDITNSPITKNIPQVAFSVTVLQHIQRPDAYKKGLLNILNSATDYVMLMDNWKNHNYFDDINEVLNNDLGKKGKLYSYDTGRQISIIISLKGVELSDAFKPLLKSETLFKYLS